MFLRQTNRILCRCQKLIAQNCSSSNSPILNLENLERRKRINKSIESTSQVLNTNPFAKENISDETKTSSNNINAFDADDEELEKLAENIMKALRTVDPDGEFGSKNLVRDPLNEPDISQMEEGTETASRPINRFRQIVYDEGELDKSNFNEPPSRENPHPFNPNNLPPTHARSLAAYVNHLPVLQNLLELGVNLLDVEINTNVGRALVRLNWQKDLQPKIHWLVKEVGVDVAVLGSYITRNPFFLLQTMENLNERINYLKSKKFSKRSIAKIVIACRYWLNTDIKIIDGRLGWIQRQFWLRGHDVRQLIVKEPRVIMFGLGPLQRLVLMFNQELGFTKSQIQDILKEDPRVFMCEPENLLTTYHYLTKVMQISNQQISKYPEVLRCPIWSIRRRHEFLMRLKKAQYNKDLPDYISLRNLIHPSDKFFAETVARTFIEDYNKYLKLI